ncbi:MAG: GTPase domain-containing protein [bacterium]|nr:GTPase domain-containing protein [bacterium]
MGMLNRETREIHAKIVYYGPAGSGKTANIEFIDRKLKKEYRGELKVSQVRDGGGQYEFLPITLGSVRGYQTSIHIYTVPGGDDYAEMRRQILDGADGVVFVADLRPERHDEVLPALAELQENLASYDRSFDDVIFVMQYNRRDQADENAVEALHRRIKLNPTASFETVASTGTGVLNTLTTLSKQIISKIRQRADAEDAGVAIQPDPAPEASPAAPVATPAAIEAPPVTAPAAASDATHDAALPESGGFSVEATGAPKRSPDGAIMIPVRLIEESSGRRVELNLRVSIDGS